MKTYPNYRVSVEVVVSKDGKILLAKRADDAKVAPGAWCVPAGKVKYTEIPVAAAVREAKEETSLDVSVKAEIACRTATIKNGDEDAYRLIYTYLVEPTDSEQEVQIDEEHSEFVWVSKEELVSGKYDSLLPEHLEIFSAHAF
tara:strand:+ start:4821 stop:5249 length:429 start_codon:yes stop_codon:yes gene_type:complete